MCGCNSPPSGRSISFSRREKVCEVILCVKCNCLSSTRSFRSCSRASRSRNSWLPLRDVAIMELFYSSGLRLSELAALDVADVDLYTESVRVLGKGRKERVCPVGLPALEAISRYRAAANVHS